MLHIEFMMPNEALKTYTNFIFDVELKFDYCYKESWMKEPIVKKIIRDIDKSDLLAPQYIMSPILGPIPPKSLSGGTKALILMNQDDEDLIIWATSCGDNCLKWMLEIGARKDYKVIFSHFPDFDRVKDIPLQFIVDNDGRLVSSMEDYIETIIDFSEVI